MEDRKSGSVRTTTGEPFDDLFSAPEHDARPSGRAGAGAGIGTSVPDAGLEEVTNKVTNLEGRVDQLTRSVGDLDKENATMVSVGTQEFQSRGDFLAWYASHKSKEGDDSIGFVDALGLCCVTITNTVGELHQNLRVEADSSKAGYSNAEAAYFAKSFTKTLPPPVCLQDG